MIPIWDALTVIAAAMFFAIVCYKRGYDVAKREFLVELEDDDNF